jgi:hypothetical protein
VALAGLATSILTAVLVTAVDHFTELNLLTFREWDFLPVGAGMCGFLAASGYYLASKLLHRRPTPILLLQMIATAAVTQGLIYWLEYRTAIIDGVFIRTVIPFAEYLDTIMTQGDLRTGPEANIDTAKVGTFGYWSAAIDLIALLVGSGLVYRKLQKQPTCGFCKRYMHVLVIKEDSFADRDALSAYYDNEFVHPVASPEFAAHVGVEYSAGTARPGTYNLQTKVLGCPRCGSQAVSEKTQVYNGNTWKDVDERTRFVQIPVGIDVADMYITA